MAVALLLAWAAIGFAACRADVTDSDQEPVEVPQATEAPAQEPVEVPQATMARAQEPRETSFEEEPSSEEESVPAESSSGIESRQEAAEVGGSPGIVLTAMEIESRTGGVSDRALVQGGVPLARGAVTDPESLLVRGPQGALIPMQARSLASWPDGSLKWAEMTFLVEDLGGSELRRLTLETSNAPISRPGALPAADLPSDLTVAFEDDTGVTGFSVKDEKPLYTGPLSSETLFRGSAAGRDGRTSIAISIATFPELGAVRYRFELEQLADGGLWRSLSLDLPHPHAVVHRGEQMGALVSSAGNGRSAVTLIPEGSHPADRGVGRRWEIWGGASLEQLSSHPIRPRLSPRYVEGTRTLGVAADVPARWRRSFESSFRRVFDRWERPGQGWSTFASLPDRDHGLEYYGYLNQEYDPATALILAYARTMEPAYLATAEDLASSFRDLSVEPGGGVFQHRSTLHTAQAHLIDQMARGLLDRIRSHRDYEESVAGLLAAVGKLYGPSGRSNAERILGRIDEGSFAESEERFARLAAAKLLEGATERIRARASSAQEIDMGRLFRLYAKDAQIKQLGVTDADETFAPFFRRYGGSWSDFPAFRIDRHPDPALRHAGSHSILEMLVLAYFLTGDEGFKSTALRVGRHHLDVLVPREIAANEALLSSSRPLFSRSLGWPLINLLSLWDLTESADPEMTGRVRDAARLVAVQLTRNPVERCEGSVSAGVAMEALARYHERTGDATVGEHLVRWARHWAATQWNSTRGAFQYRHDQREPAWSSLTGLVLHGLVYAHHLEPDQALRQRIIEARDSLLAAETGYAKAFAMYYRSVPRALALMEPPTGS